MNFVLATLHLTESVELFEENIFQAGFLLKFATGRFIERFVHADEAAGQRPLALERFQRAFDQQHLQFAFVQAEDDAVHGQGCPGV